MEEHILDYTGEELDQLLNSITDLENNFISNEGGEIKGDLTIDSSYGNIVFKNEDGGFADGLVTGSIEHTSQGNLIFRTDSQIAPQLSLLLALDDGYTGEYQAYLTKGNNYPPHYLVTSNCMKPDFSQRIYKSQWEESSEIPGTIFARTDEIAGEHHVTASDHPIIDIDLSRATSLSEIQSLENFWNKIYRANTSDEYSYITLYSTASLDEVPEYLYINIKVVG